MKDKRIPDALAEALSLDVTVVEGLLQQHRHSHRRAKYFHRLTMTVKALKRCKILELDQRLESFRQQVNGMAQQRKRKRQKQQEEEQWELSNLSHQNNKIAENRHPLEAPYTSMQQMIEEDIPQALSRIQHAADPILTEISRGFFLPFMTVALAALARIRLLIRKFAKLVVLEMLECHSDLQKLVANSKDMRFSTKLWTVQHMNQLIERYMDPDLTGIDRQSLLPRLTKEQLRESTLKSIGWNVSRASSKTTSSNDNGSGMDTPSRSGTPVTQEEAGNLSTEDDPNDKSEDNDMNIMEELPDENDDKPSSKHNGSDKLTATMNEDVGDDDVGETVESATHASAKELDQAAGIMNVKSSVDQNLEIARRQKETKKQQKAIDTSSKKRKAKFSSSSSLNDSKKSKKKKKKSSKEGGKKKKSKGDFFDSLFS